MYGPTEATSTETALLEPRRSLQNVGSKDKDEDEERRLNGGGDQFHAFGADGFTFLDFLDIINPLQHIPVVGSLYRDMTGDEIDPASRVIGSTLFGGPVGTVASLVNVSLEQSTGKDMGDHVLAFLGGEDSATEGGDGAPMLANAPVASGQLADASLIPENLEVLNWARREAAFMNGTGGADEQAALRPEVSIASAAGISDTTAKAERVAKRTGDISGHMEVLDWARNEAAATRAAVDRAAAAKDTEEGTVARTAEDIRQSGEARTLQTNTRHDQLSGATAPGGGWFTETMLTAMTNYEQSAQLGKVNDPRSGLKSVNVSN
ncbi:MAG: hypothetical protein HOK06_02700 [Rhodospirillaceae bacterium]|nr:hypothetical protein [Rhodospirillaceae bacterium]MBT5309401.1 hypothetical protein [Rhodospirillaceae bacterium]MBT6406487.1 hypothetical protein [Rhodospirillaceae bacterium]MBT7356584.1 hypothetical protein [Rhodospirillaceae bacterium]